jgi:TolB-like protein/cytochrome c-type biogenesis protein CcmH/NrfG
LSFFKELQRRNVFKVAAAYVVVGWLIMQIGDVMAPALHLPGWIDSALAFFVILGFPVAIVLSWAFNVTPEGIRTEKSSGRDDDVAVPAGQQLTIAVVVLFALAAGFVAFDKFVLAPERDSEHIQVPDQVTRERSQAAVAQTGSSIAVLAFEDMSPEQDQQYLSDGIAEELLNALAQIPDLKVISRSSAFSYKGKDVKLGQIAAELDVGHILEGSVRKSGNRVRITAQLIDAHTDTHLWSETYDKTLDDIFAVQEDVARSVVASLRATLSPRADERISKHPTDDLAAYDLYLRGREALHLNEAESNRVAIRLFEEAIELDPAYALAWTGLADSYAQRDGRFGFPHGSTANTAVEYARKALAIDPDLAEAHRALGYAYLRLGENDDGLGAYLAAVEMNPNYYEVWAGLSWFYETTGRYDDGVLAGERAHRLAPNELLPLFYLAHNYKYLSLDEKVMEVTRKMLRLDPLNDGGRLFEPQLAVYHGDFDTAVRLAEQIVRDTPDHAYAMVGAASMVYMARDYERAINWAREALRLEPGNSLGYWHHNEVLIGLSLLQFGQQEEAEHLLLPVIEAYQERVEKGQRDWGLEWDLASIHAVRGERKEAMDWFERAYEAGFRFVRWAPVDPAFDAFRDDARYLNVMARMEADIERMRTRLFEADPSLAP